MLLDCSSRERLYPPLWSRANHARRPRPNPRRRPRSFHLTCRSCPMKWRPAAWSRSSAQTGSLEKKSQSASFQPCLHPMSARRSWQSPSPMCRAALNLRPHCRRRLCRACGRCMRKRAPPADLPLTRCLCCNPRSRHRPPRSRRRRRRRHRRNSRPAWLSRASRVPPPPRQSRFHRRRLCRPSRIGAVITLQTPAWLASHRSSATTQSLISTGVTAHPTRAFHRTSSRCAGRATCSLRMAPIVLSSVWMTACGCMWTMCWCWMPGSMGQRAM